MAKLGLCLNESISIYSIRQAALLLEENPNITVKELLKRFPAFNYSSVDISAAPFSAKESFIEPQLVTPSKKLQTLAVWSPNFFLQNTTSKKYFANITTQSTTLLADFTLFHYSLYGGFVGVLLLPAWFLLGLKSRKKISEIKALNKKTNKNALVHLTVKNAIKLQRLQMLVDSIVNTATEIPTDLALINKDTLHDALLVGEALIAKYQKLQNAVFNFSLKVHSLKHSSKIATSFIDLDIKAAEKLVLSLEKDYDALLKHLSSLKTSVSHLAEQESLLLARQELHAAMTSAGFEKGKALQASEFVSQLTEAQKALVLTLSNMQTNSPLF